MCAATATKLVAAAAAAALAPWWRRTAPRLRRGLVHGDFHGRNVLFRGDAIVAVLDFDFCAVRPRAFDLGYPLVFSLLGMARTTPMALSRVPELLDAYDMTAMAALNWLARAHDEMDPESAVLGEREFVALAERLLPSVEGVQ